MSFLVTPANGKRVAYVGKTSNRIDAWSQ